MKFFDLHGQPLAFPFVDDESGVSELAGTFRAVKATGEPTR
jgi:hypothetical protein